MFENLSPNMKAAIFTAIVTLILAAFAGFYTLATILEPKTWKQ